MPGRWRCRAPRLQDETRPSNTEAAAQQPVVGQPAAGVPVKQPRAALRCCARLCSGVLLVEDDDICEMLPTNTQECAEAGRAPPWARLFRRQAGSTATRPQPEASSRVEGKEGWQGRLQLTRRSSIRFQWIPVAFRLALARRLARRLACPRGLRGVQCDPKAAGLCDLEKLGSVSPSPAGAGGCRGLYSAGDRI